MKSKNPTYTVLVIDEVSTSRDRLCTLLENHAPDFRVDAACTDIEEAKLALAVFQPALVFLSVERHIRHSPELLRLMPSEDLEVIFTSHSREYAFEAFKFGALDFLLKPVDEEALANTLVRFRRYRPADRREVPRASVPLLPSPSTMIHRVQKLVVPTRDSLLFLNVRDILFIRSNNNQTILHLKDNKTVATSKTLRYFENRLPDPWFFRVHASCLVNLTEVSEYTRKQGGKVILSNGERIDVSRLRRSELLKMF